MNEVHAVAQGIAVVRALEAVYPSQHVEDSGASGTHGKHDKKKSKKKKNKKAKKPKKAPLLKRAAAAGWSAVLGATDVFTGASRRRRRRNIAALATFSTVDAAATINDSTDVLRATEAAARCAMAAEENRTRRVEGQVRRRRAREAILEDFRRRHGPGGLMQRARRMVLLHATAAAVEPQLSLVLDGIDFITGEPEPTDGTDGVRSVSQAGPDTVSVPQMGRRWYKPDDHNALAKRGQLLLLRNKPVDAERMLCKATEHGHARHGGGAALLRQLATARYGVWRQCCTPQALASAYDTFVRAAQYPANQASSEFDRESSRGLRNHVPVLLHQVSKLHAGHGSFSGALSLLDKLLSDFPSFKHSDVEHQYARILFHLGYYEGAVALWRAQLGSAADNANVVDGAVYAGSYIGDDDDVESEAESDANTGGASAVVAPLPYQAPDLRFQIARALELLDRAGEGTLRPVRFDAAAIADIDGTRQRAGMGQGVLPPLLADEGSRRSERKDEQTGGNDVAADSPGNSLVALSNGDMTASRRTNMRASPGEDDCFDTDGEINLGSVGHFGRALTGSAVTVPCHRAHAMTVGRHVVEMVVTACHGQHLGIGVCFVGHDLAVPLGSCSTVERDIGSKVKASAADDGETEDTKTDNNTCSSDAEDPSEDHEGQDLSGAHDLAAEREAVTRVAEGARSWCFRSGGAARFGGLERPYGQAFAAGDRILMEVDIDDGTLTYYKNGECLGVAFRDMRKAWRGRALVPAVSLKEDGDKVMLVGTVKLPVKVGPLAPNNLAYRAYERYFEEEVMSRPRQLGEGGDGYENGSGVGAPSDGVAMAMKTEVGLSTEPVAEADGVQLAAWGDEQVVGTGGPALALLGAIPVMWPPPRPSDGHGRRDQHKYKFDWRHDYMCWRARGLRYRSLEHWELALDAFTEAVELAHTLGVYREPGVFDPLSETAVSEHNKGLCIGALPELLLLQCDAQRHFSEHAAALVSAKRALSFDRFNRTLRRLLSSLYPEAFGPIFRRQNLAATAIAAFYRGCVGRHFARKRIAGAIFSQRTIHAAFARRERGRHGAAALVGEMWNAAFAPRALAANWLRAAYWDERDRLFIFSAALSIQHAWRTYAMYLKRFNASIKVQKSWRSHRVRHALLAATQRAQQHRVNVDGPRRIQEALTARDRADGWGDRASTTASDPRLTAAAITQRRHDAAAAAARSGRLAAHRRRSKELTMEERKRGHWPKSFATQDESARDVARTKHAQNPNMTSKALEARVANKSNTMGALDEKRLLALGVEDALVGVPVLTREAVTVELPKHLTGGGADGGEGKVASLLRKLRERGRYRTVYEWIPAKLFLSRLAPELIELPLVEAARRLKLEANDWCKANDAEEQVGFKWRRKGTRRELDFDFDFLDETVGNATEEATVDDTLAMTSAGSLAIDASEESGIQDAAVDDENVAKVQGGRQRKVKSPSKNMLSRVVRSVPDSGAEPIPFSPSHLCDRTRTFQQGKSELGRKAVQAELDSDLNDDEVRLHVSFVDKAKHAPMNTEPGIFDNDVDADGDGDSVVDSTAETSSDSRRRAAEPIGATSYTIEGRKPLEVSSGYGVAVHGVRGIYRSQGYQTSVPGLNDPVFRAHRFYVVQVHEEEENESLATGANSSAADARTAQKRRAARQGHLRFELRRRTPADGGGATLAQWRPQVADRSLAPQNRAQYLSGGTGKQPFEELAHEHEKRNRAGGAGAGGPHTASQRAVDKTSADAKVQRHANKETAPTTRVIRGGKPLAFPARFKPGVNSLLRAQERDAHTVGVAPSRFAANPVITSNGKSGATGSGSKKGAVSLAVAKGRDAEATKLAPLRESKRAAARAAEEEAGESTARFSFAAQRKRLAARASQQRAQDEEVFREQRERDIELGPVLGSTPTRAPRRRDDFGALSSVDYRVEMLPNGALGRGTVQTEFQITSPLGKGTALYRVPGWSGLRDPLLAASVAGSEAESTLPPIGGGTLGASHSRTGTLSQSLARDVPVSVDGRELQQLTLSRTALAKQRTRNMETSHGLVSEAAPTPQFVKVSGGMDREELSSSATRISAEWHKTVF